MAFPGASASGQGVFDPVERGKRGRHDDKEARKAAHRRRSFSASVVTIHDRSKRFQGHRRISASAARASARSRFPKGRHATGRNGKIGREGAEGQLSRPAHPRTVDPVKIATTKSPYCPPYREGRDGARFQGLARALISGKVGGAGGRRLREDALGGRHGLTGAEVGRADGST